MCKRGFLCLFSAVFALTLSAFAAAHPDPLPPQIEGHVSVKSPVDLLQNLDGYIAASTRGTAKAIPPGFLSMMAQIYLPLPLDSWNSDGETHLIVCNTPGSRRPRYVGVFGVSDFDAFAESLEERDWIFGDGDGDFRPVILPNGIAMALADLGDGRVAIGDDAESIRSALDGWTPTHDTDADIALHASTRLGNFNLAEMVIERMESETDSLVAAIAGSGFKPEAAKGFVDTLKRLMPLVADELSHIKNISCEIGINGELMYVEPLVRPGTATLLAEVADNLGQARNVDASMGECIPSGAITANVGAEFANILPNARSRVVKWTASIYGGLSPAIRDKAAAIAGEIMDSEPGATAVGTYIDGVRQYNITVNRNKDPEKALGGFLGSIGLINDLWAQSIDEPGYGFELAGGEKSAGGAVYYAFRPVFADAAKFQTLLDRLTRGSSELAIDADLLARQRFFLAGLQDGIVYAAGELDDEEFLAKLAEVRSPSGPALIATDAARKVIAMLPNAQASVGVFDASATYGIYAAQQIREAAARGGKEAADRLALAYAETMKNRKTNGEVIGFSLGAEDGWLIGRFLVPAGVVGQVIGDIDNLDRARKRAGALPDPTRYPDEYEDDLEEEMEPGDEDSDAA